jgi:uncharacterized membrane protein YtjA (UPF0391 family)
MSAVLVFALAVAAAALGALDLGAIVAVVAKAAFLVVPAVFMVSLVWGLSSLKKG